MEDSFILTACAKKDQFDVSTKQVMKVAAHVGIFFSNEASVTRVHTKITLQSGIKTKKVNVDADSDESAEDPGGSNLEAGCLMSQRNR